MRPPGNRLGSQASGMIKEDPGNFETAREIGGKSLGAEGFGRVMAAVKDVDSQILRCCKCMVRPFARDERSEARIGGKFQITACAAGDDADFFAGRRAAGKNG